MDDESEKYPKGTAENLPAAEPEAPVKNDRVSGAVKEILDWVKSIVIALLIAIVFKMTIVQSYAVPTESMVPTVMPNDRFFGSRITLRFREPEHGEVITFKPPDSIPNREKDRFGNTIPFMKRVIALEGDVVEVKSGLVFINGKPSKEPYINEKPFYDMPPLKVPSGYLFVLGDNRNNSYDSHLWGFLDKKNVDSIIFMRFWPPLRAGLVK